MCIKAVNSSCCPSARRTDKGLRWWRMRSRHQLHRLVGAVVVAPHKHLQLRLRVELLHLLRLQAEEEVEARRPLHREASNKRRTLPCKRTPVGIFNLDGCCGICGFHVLNRTECVP